MMKKLIYGVTTIVLVFILVACGKDITLDIDQLTITVTEGDTYQIEANTNDDKGLTYTSNDSSIATVSVDGLITSLKEGSTKIVITSKTNIDQSIEITVFVEKRIAISIEEDTLTLKVGDNLSVDFTANDDVVMTSDDTDIFTVNTQGVITGVAEGQATLKIASVIDNNIFQEIIINVRKIVDLSVNQSELSLWIGKSEQLIYISNDDVMFESTNTSIVTVSETGEIIGVAQGSAQVRVYSTYDEDVFYLVEISVFLDAETIILSGFNQLILNDERALTVEIGPDLAYDQVSWISSDENIATVSEDGIVTAKAVGDVTITAISEFDPLLSDSIDIEIINVLLVNQTSVTGDEVEMLGVTFVYGLTLFDQISDAMDQAVTGVTIYIIGEDPYTTDFTIDVDQVTLIGELTTNFSQTITIQANQVSIQNIHFTGTANLITNAEIDGFEFKNNTVDVTSTAPFMALETTNNINIENNTFDNDAGDAIFVEGFLYGQIRIYNNTISSLGKAISLIAVNEYDAQTQIMVERNTITQANGAIEINLDYNGQKDIEAIVRFNQVSNYGTYAAKSHLDHSIEYTLNYWGAIEPVYSDFVNISEYELRGFYGIPSDIITASRFNPIVPVKILPTESYVLLEVGEAYTIEYEVLPSSADPDRVRFITSNTKVVQFRGYGVISPLESGYADVTLRVSTDFSVNSIMNIEVTTDPGIELTPNVISQSVLVGDEFSLSAKVFPFQIKDDLVMFESLQPSIATIDQAGIVTSLQAGKVTFKAFLANDPSVITEFTAEFFDQLDDTNLLDLLTRNQVSYTTPHTWTAYGVTHNYVDFKYESVSKYYFGSYEINQSKMLPEFFAIRPGEPMEPHPEDVTQYNPYNVYWVVIHDTANTQVGGGALAHANYLWNATVNKTELWVSWHFSIDDRELYQHLPETERGFHAGDGSSLPLHGTTYLGGGNRNGIGIETGVNQDADVYRTWQRTAKLVADLLTKYNLPRENMQYHNDFSGKDCPRTMRNAGLIPLFEEFVDIEYQVSENYSNALITFESDNPEYVDNTGRIIMMPERAMTVSYTVTITIDSVSTSRTFYSYLPGTVH